MVHLNAPCIPFPKGYRDSVSREVAEAAMSSRGIGESPSVAVVLDKEVELTYSHVRDHTDDATA